MGVIIGPYTQAVAWFKNDSITTYDPDQAIRVSVWHQVNNVDNIRFNLQLLSNASQIEAWREITGINTTPAPKSVSGLVGSFDVRQVLRIAYSEVASVLNATLDVPAPQRQYIEGDDQTGNEVQLSVFNTDVQGTLFGPDGKPSNSYRNSQVTFNGSQFMRSVGVNGQIRHTVVWADGRGGTRMTHWLENPATDVIRDDIKLISNADWLWGMVAPVTFGPPPSSPDAKYLDLDTYAELVYQTAAGTRLTLKVPAPVANLFLADQVTVDPLKADTVNTSAIGNLCNLDGIVATSYIGGTRKFRVSNVI